MGYFSRTTVEIVAIGRPRLARFTWITPLKLPVGLTRQPKPTGSGMGRVNQSSRFSKVPPDAFPLPLVFANSSPARPPLTPLLAGRAAQKRVAGRPAEFPSPKSQATGTLSARARAAAS
jgi:hypothetical protein